MNKTFTITEKFIWENGEMKSLSKFLIIVLALVLSSCGSDNPLGNTTSYTNSVVAYKLTVPEGWQTKENPVNRSQLELTKGTAQINVIVISNTENAELSDLSGSDLSEFDREFVNASGILNYDRTTSSGLLGTLVAVVLNWTGNSSAGQNFRGQTIIAINSDYIFLLQYFDHAGDFDLKDFEIVKGSFLPPS